MFKRETRYICQECGYESLKWLGRCPGCDKWNSMIEEVLALEKKSLSKVYPKEAPVPLAQVDMSVEERYSTQIGEFDRVLGGGVVPGSLILVGGDPGIGKSTLLLQVAEELSRKQGKTLYVSGEESVKQIRLRSLRMKTDSEDLWIVSENDIEIIEQYIDNIKPNFVMIDSIQTVYYSQLQSAPATVSQVRECTGQLMRIAKTSQIPIFIVGHVTKEGVIAGPRVLEHIVDTVLYFEGDRHQTYRILRAVKNRYGSTNELGIFEMEDNGLREVINPSEVFLAERKADVAGSVVLCTMEGTRPILVEIQALVSPTYFGVPRRMSSGIDYDRVSLILAVLEKRIGMNLSNQDVYINVAGGIKIEEPAADLGVIVALASSFRDVPVYPKMMVAGEVGLVGEVREISHLQNRLREALRLGFKRCVIPKHNISPFEGYQDKEIIGVQTVKQALEACLDYSAP